MALNASKLLRLGPQNSNGPTVWAYNAGADTHADVDGAGYFNAVADRLKVGDFILCVANNNANFGIMVVNSNTRDLTASPPVMGAVDVTNATPIGAVDSD